MQARENLSACDACGWRNFTSKQLVKAHAEVYSEELGKKASYNGVRVIEGIYERRVKHEESLR